MYSSKINVKSNSFPSEIALYFKGKNYSWKPCLLMQALYMCWHAPYLKLCRARKVISSDIKYFTHLHFHPF